MVKIDIMYKAHYMSHVVRCTCNVFVPYDKLYASCNASAKDDHVDPVITFDWIREHTGESKLDVSLFPSADVFDVSIVPMYFDYEDYVHFVKDHTSHIVSGEPCAVSREDYEKEHLFVK